MQFSLESVAVRAGTVRPQGDAIRKLRRERGWTQQELADKIGCDKKTIENLEAGKPVILKTIRELAQAFGKPVQIAHLIERDPTIPETTTPMTPRLAIGTAPPLAPMLFGREKDLIALQNRLSRAANDRTFSTQVLTAVRGWPGVGKTTLAKALAHSSEMAKAFPDGVLWASLGPCPSVDAELRSWLRALDADLSTPQLANQEASDRLSALLRERKMLLIVDDVWDAMHAKPFLVGGRGCGMLVTTRLPIVSHALVPSPDDRYLLDVLDDDASFALLQELAPHVVARQPKHCRELVQVLEKLPLALQVAGRLLQAEQEKGWGVEQLLDELRASAARILNEPAPADVAAAGSVSPTVTALLQKSTDVLEPDIRKRFAYLAPFAPKPATFELDDLQAIWKISEHDARTTISTLVDRGLLEPSGTGDFQIHQVIVEHAKTLLPKRPKAKS